MTHSRNKLAIFDLDGTLVDTAPDLVAALNYVLLQKGLAPVSVEEGRRASGKGVQALLTYGFVKNNCSLSLTHSQECSRIFLEFYAAHSARESRPYPFVREALHVLRTQGWICTVCTNKRHDLAVSLLAQLNLLPSFDKILGAGLLAEVKPHPLPLLFLLEATQADPAQSVMIGDTDTDFLAAKNAGFPMIWIEDVQDLDRAETGSSLLSTGERPSEQEQISSCSENLKEGNGYLRLSSFQYLPEALTNLLRERRQSPPERN